VKMALSMMLFAGGGFDLAINQRFSAIMRLIPSHTRR